MYCFKEIFNQENKRTWSRRQNVCSSIPQLGKNISLNLLIDLRKGNILQYYKNSSQLTKQQQYAQICRGLWSNRTKTYATQSDKYTNPNTNSLKRVNTTNIIISTNYYAKGIEELNCINLYPIIVNPDLPNIPSNIPIINPPPIIPPPPPIKPGGNSNDIPVVPIFPRQPTIITKDGGSLICNTITNQCTGELINKTEKTFCYPTTLSDIPSSPNMKLCYKDGLVNK